MQLTSEKAVLIILIFKTYLELLKYPEFQFQIKELLKMFYREINISELPRQWWRTPLFRALNRQRQTDLWVQG